LVTGHYRGSRAVREDRWTPSHPRAAVSPRTAGITSLHQLTDTAAWIEAMGDDAPLDTIDYSVTDGVQPSV